MLFGLLLRSYTVSVLTNSISSKMHIDDFGLYFTAA